MNVADRYLPISSAYTGKSCINCCNSPDKKLLRCASCKLACYCCKACQRTDWPKHKVECKLLKFLKQIYPDIPGDDSHRLGKAHMFLETLPLLLEAAAADHSDLPLPKPSEVEKLQKERFIKFVTFCRCCSICLHHDFSSSAEKIDIDWQCCPDCNFGWCCSSQHWDEYKGQHTPEICNSYRQSTSIELFHYQHAKKNNEIFIHMPETTLTSPSDLPVFPQTWDAYFRTRCAGFYPEFLPRLPPELFPAGTRLLSQPVTCLAAMYKFGISHFSNIEDDITIHVVGADSYEVPATQVWEEILHCLPKARSLTMEFIGPDACKCIKGNIKEYPTEPVLSVCPDCTATGRQRHTGMFGYTYHEYRQIYSSSKKKPDFIVAFNTGMFENDTESWKTSLEVILDMNVPAYVTSYCKQEAVADFALLQGMDANILQNGPEENPFGDQGMSVEPTTEGRIDSFFANNLYGVLFQGKKITTTK